MRCSRSDDDALSVCPKCGGELRKVMSPVGIHFKGSGFYRNDSRKAKSGAGAKTATAGDTAPAGATGSESGGSSRADPVGRQ